MYQKRLNDLRALRQLIVRQLHQIGRETFEGYLEREVLYDIVEQRGRMQKEKEKEKEKIIRGKNVVERLLASVASSTC
jgi:hypothetical protein